MICSVEITFCFANGDKQKTKARLGDSLKDTADAFHLPIPGIVRMQFRLGNCKGTGLPRQVFSQEHYTKDVFNKEGVSCEYCHVVLEDSVMNQIKKPEVGEQLWLDHQLINRNKKYG